jgi:hypothetical protein
MNINPKKILQNRLIDMNTIMAKENASAPPIL